MNLSIQFKDQADAIEQLCLKVFGAKPVYANGFRYFSDGNCYWKMPPQGNGFIRHSNEKEWDDSICDISDIDPSCLEISAEEGEP
jgi:hypothetical protein